MWHRGHVCTCPLCHMIYHSCDKGSWRQSPLSTARYCNVCGRNLITGLTSAVSPRVVISSTCKVGQKLGVSLPLLTCSPSAWPSQLLYCRGRKSWRDLLITLYLWMYIIITQLVPSITPYTQFMYCFNIHVPRHWSSVYKLSCWVRMWQILE
jgi:hypothetical protein